MDSLVVALPVFFASAVAVVVAGIGLARYGDELADQTGWGHLWVGTVLVATATSLPELFTNITAISIGVPALALGNIFGANMMNMWALALVALLFGASGFSRAPAREIVVLAVVAILITGLALSMSVGEASVALGVFSLGGVVVVVAYLAGMRAVYVARPAAAPVSGPVAGRSLFQTWLFFMGAAAIIAVAAPFLAVSADGIAEATGLARSFMGVLVVSAVTTLPEATVTVAAIRRGLYSLALGNLYGSCAFNVAIIAVIDPINGRQPVLRAMDPEHFAAGGVAVLLMGLGLLAMLLRRWWSVVWLRGLLAAMLGVYPAGLYWVFILGR